MFSKFLAITRSVTELAALFLLLTPLGLVNEVEAAGVSAPTYDELPLLKAPPDFDAFYDQPARRVAGAQPGDILASRKVTLQNLLSFNALGPWDVDSWQIAYRSNNTRGQPITAVATVLKPRGMVRGPRKLFSINAPENSTAGYCAPSYVLRYGNALPTAAVGQLTVPLQARFMQMALNQGMAVIVPDDEGPDSAFSAGRLAAQITLDGIRAATHFAPLETEPGVPVGLIGYSGGAIGVSHAAEMASAYAPDLNIVGVAEGGIMANLEAALEQANRGPTTGLPLAAVMGLAREYPPLADELERVAPWDIKALMAIKQPFCTGWQTALLPFEDLVGKLNYRENPVSQAVLDEENLGHSAPDMPLFVWQSRQDEFFAISQVDDLVDYYCRAFRIRLEYVRDGVPGHILTALDGGATAVHWLIDRLNGIEVEPGCTIENANSLLLDE